MDSSNTTTEKQDTTMADATEHETKETATPEAEATQAEQQQDESLAETSSSEFQEQEEEQSFAEMLEQSDTQAGGPARVGEKLSGSIIAIEGENVFIDTGSKIDGVCERSELLDDEGQLTVAVGDSVELYVVAASANEIRLSKALSGIGGLENLRDAFENQLPVEGRVAESRKGGFTIEMMHRKVFCPVSQIDIRFVEKPEEYVGEKFTFQIIKFEQNGRNIVVSRRSLLEKERDEAVASFMDSVKPEDVMEGTVVRLAPFGAFVELATGLEGMCHISELDWARVDDPADAVAIGDKITVKILSMDHDDKGRLKLSLSRKQCMDDPWNTVASRIKEGDRMEGRVSRLAKFGAFVELEPGIDGLIHLSQMSYTRRVNKADEVVSPGETVSVVVKEVDPVKRRISLSLREAEGDPWVLAAKELVPGAKVTGTMEKRETFGLFINLRPGVTGLMPKSKLRSSANPSALEKLSTGDKVEVLIAEVNLDDRKMTLAPADAKDDGMGEDDWKRAPGASPKGKSFSVGGGGSFGSLGDKLAKAMKEKK